jgi:hypothetical protein
MLASRLIFYCGRDELSGEVFAKFVANLDDARKFRLGWNFRWLANFH